MPGTLVRFGTTCTRRSVADTRQSAELWAKYLKIAPTKHALVEYQGLGYQVRLRKFYIRIPARCCELLHAPKKMTQCDPEKFSKRIAVEVQLTL